MKDYWPYIAIVFLILCSAFFSSSEIAYASANKLRLKKASETGGLRQRWAQAISEQYERALCTILMGNNLVNIGASSVATLIALSLVGEVGAAYATGIMTVLILIFGEILPKQIAKKHADSFVLVMSPPLRLLMMITGPLVVVVMAVVENVSRIWGGKSEKIAMTEDELITIIETVEEEGIIDEVRRDLLQSAIEFAEITAEEITTHRVDILSIDINDSMDEILKIAEELPYSRIPVCDGSMDNIIGVLFLNHLWKALLDRESPSVRELLTEVCYVHKSKSLPVILEEMQRRKTHMAVVIDDYGGTLGIITMEDILEQLVGDIWDESDEIRNELVEVGENLFEVDGGMSIYGFLERLDMDDSEFEDHFVTIGGWAIEMLKDFPSLGESFLYKNLKVTVAEMTELRITKLEVRIMRESNL